MLKNVMQELAAAIAGSRHPAALDASPSIEVPVPDVSLSAEALAWVPPSGFEQMRRRTWPFPEIKDVDLSDFQKYLITTEGLEPDTAATRASQVKCFMGLFVLPTGFNHIGFLCALYSSGLGRQAGGLSVMSSERPLVRSIYVAVSYFIDYSLVLSNEKRHFEAHRCLLALKNDVIKPLKKSQIVAKLRARYEKMIGMQNGSTVSQQSPKRKRQ